MANEWKLTTLGEFVRLQRGHDLTAEERIPGTFPVMGSAGQNGTHGKFISRGPGVVIGRSGASMGRVHYVKSDYWPHNTCLYVTDFLGNDPRFTFYFLGALDLASYNSGSAQPSLNRNFIYTKSITVPPPKEQHAIANILGTLDDKLDVNRRMNETLEAMARALFKAWFVDFEPVRAKQEGRWQRGQSLPGLPAHLYDLFPDRLIESDLGEIPDGWDAGSFGRIVSQRSERAGKRAVTVLSAVASGKLARSDDHFSKRVYSKDTDKYLLVEQWDFAYNPSRINIGSIGMLEDNVIGGVSPVYVVARPKDSYQWFLEFSIRRAQTKTWINTLASGSVRQSLSYTDFASIPCVIPTEAVIEEFNRRWFTLRDGIRSREAESRSLTHHRDTLLPKLISGELRVPDVERIVGAAV